MSEVKERRKFADLSLAQQAGIRAHDQAFAHFVVERFGYFGDYAQFIRNHCGVASRAELGANDDAAARWVRLNNEFESWLHAE